MVETKVRVAVLVVPSSYLPRWAGLHVAGLEHAHHVELMGRKCPLVRNGKGEYHHHESDFPAIAGQERGGFCMADSDSVLEAVPVAVRLTSLCGET